MYLLCAWLSGVTLERNRQISGRTYGFGVRRGKAERVGERIGWMEALQLSKRHKLGSSRPHWTDFLFALRGEAGEAAFVSEAAIVCSAVSIFAG